MSAFLDGGSGGGLSEIIIGTTQVIGGMAGDVLIVGANGTTLDGAARRLLMADATYYVNSATGSDSNPGTLAEPFATLQYAWDYLSDSLDLGSFTLTINLEGAGPYTLYAANGWIGGASVNVLGAGSTVTALNNLEFQTLPGQAGGFVLGPTIQFDGMAFNDNGMGVNANVTSYAAGHLVLGDIVHDIAFGPNDTSFVNGYAQIQCVNPGCIINMYGNVTMNGPAASIATVGGIGFLASNSVITLVGNPAYSILSYVSEGSIWESEDTYIGSQSGQDVFITSNGEQNGGAVLPGTSGILNLGGVYTALPPQQILTPSNGDTVSLSGTQPLTILNPAAPLATLTINLPIDNPGYTQILQRVSSTKAITAITFVSMTASSMVGLPTSLAAGAGIGLCYDGNSNTWYPG